MPLDEGKVEEVLNELAIRRLVLLGGLFDPLSLDGPDGDGGDARFHDLFEQKDLHELVLSLFRQRIAELFITQRVNVRKCLVQLSKKLLARLAHLLFSLQADNPTNETNHEIPEDTAALLAGHWSITHLLIVQELVDRCHHQRRVLCHPLAVLNQHRSDQVHSQWRHEKLHGGRHQTQEAV